MNSLVLMLKMLILLVRRHDWCLESEKVIHAFVLAPVVFCDSDEKQQKFCTKFEISSIDHRCN